MELLRLSIRVFHLKEIILKHKVVYLEQVDFTFVRSVSYSQNCIENKSL